MLRKISQNFSSSIQTEYDSLLFSIKKKTMKKRVMIRKFVLKVDTFMQWRRTWLLYFSSKAILQIFAFISARFVGIGKIVECFCFFSMLRWYHYMTQKRWEFCALFPQIALKLIWIIVWIMIFHGKQKWYSEILSTPNKSYFDVVKAYTLPKSFFSR